MTWNTNLLVRNRNVVTLLHESKKMDRSDLGCLCFYVGDFVDYHAQGSNIAKYLFTGNRHRHHKEFSYGAVFSRTRCEVHDCTQSNRFQIDVVAKTRNICLSKNGARRYIRGHWLKIISGTRNFWQQKAIWERKWQSNTPMFGTGIDNAKHILRYSSMPGSSRHHWGTDLDINSLEPGYFKAGRGLREITWLRQHAGEFGFCEVYSPRSTGRLRGYEPESWHWSYMPLAKQYLSHYSTNVKYEDFNQFYGSRLAKDLRIIEDFVGGISNCVDTDL